MATFSAVGNSASVLVRDDHELSLAISGTFGATLELQELLGRNDWRTVQKFTAARSGNLQLPRGTYRLACTAYASGTVTYTIAEAAKLLFSYRNPSTGSVVFSIDSDGNVVGGGTGGAAAATLVALTDAATIAVDAAVLTNGSTATVTLGGNRTLANVSNLTAGTPWSATLIVKQDGTGSRTLGFGANYKADGGIMPVASTAANATDVYQLHYDGSTLYVSLAIRGAA